MIRSGTLLMNIFAHHFTVLHSVLPITELLKETHRSVMTAICISCFKPHDGNCV